MKKVKFNSDNYFNCDKNLSCGNEIDSSVVGRATGTSQLVGMSII